MIDEMREVGMHNWFYTLRGQKHGPVSLQEILEQVRTGAFDPKTEQLWNPSLPGWTQASMVLSVYDAIQPAPPMKAPGAEASPTAEPSPVAEPTSSRGVDPPKEILHGSDPIEPTRCVRRAYELMMANFGFLLVTGLIYFAVTFGLAFGFAFLEQMARFSMGALATTAVFWTGQIVQTTVSLLVALGGIRIGLNLIAGVPVTFGMLFGQGDKMLRQFVVAVFFGAVSYLFLQAVVSGVTYFGARNNMPAVAFVLFVALAIFVVVLYVFVGYSHFATAIVDRDLGIMEALDYSWSLTTDNRARLIVLWLILGGLLLLGLAACLVGVLLVWPMATLAPLIAYRWMQYGRGAALGS